MTDNAPTTQEWARLYDAAIRVKALAPWTWMTSTEFFAVRNPETDEIGYVSVMGELGEHLAVALYLGAEGLWGLLRMEGSDEEYAPPEDILSTPHLQAAFMDRNDLTDQDRAQIKALGLKFRGRQAWPWFRSFRPGYFPWYLEAHEARFLAVALEQLLAVAERLKRGESFLNEDGSLLIRVAGQEGDALVWKDGRQAEPPPPPEPMTLRFRLDPELLAALRAKDAWIPAVEIDLVFVQGGFGERGTRPRVAFELLIVEAAHGFIIGCEWLVADPDLATVYEQFPGAILRQLAALGVRPEVVRARSDILLDLLDEIADDLGFEVEACDELPYVDEALASQEEFLGR
jgi:hypothetical protein